MEPQLLVPLLIAALAASFLIHLRRRQRLMAPRRER